MKNIKVAIIGATGLVGKTLIKIFSEKNLVFDRLYLYATEKSAGKIINYRDKEIIIKSFNLSSFPICDYIFVCAGNDFSKKYALKLTNYGTVIDNSSIYRLSKNVPLIIPEINGNKITCNDRLIANPNCTTAILAIPIKIISKEYEIKEITITSLQAVSGSGIQGIESLQNKNNNNFYSYDITQNCIPKIGNCKKCSSSEEEQKIQDEMNKILNNYDTQINATCIRVPIINTHSISVKLQLNKKAVIEKIYKLLNECDQLIIIDDPSNDKYPVASIANEKNEIAIGRIRLGSDENTLLFYLTGDNLRRGAAYNAYKIMEYHLNVSF